MSLTLNKCRFSLLEAVNEYSDDSLITYRLLDQYIEEYRVKWIELMYNKFNKQIPQVYFQTLPCVPVELKDSAECCSNLTGCELLSSVDEMPGFVSLSDGELISKIQPIGITHIPYYLIPYEKVPYYGNSRYNHTSIATFYYNNRIYLYTKASQLYPLIEMFSIVAVFRYPSEAGRFVDCNGKPCWTPDSPYPMDERLWNYVKRDILEKEFNIKLQTPEDLTNNAKGDTKTVPRSQGEEATGQ